MELQFDREKKKIYVTLVNKKHVLNMTQKWRDLFGTPIVCSNCRAFVKLPFDYCAERNKIICRSCGRPTSDIKSQQEVCRLSLIMNEHYHYLILKIKIIEDKK